MVLVLMSRTTKGAICYIMPAVVSGRWQMAQIAENQPFGEQELDASQASIDGLGPSSVLVRNENIVFTDLDDTIVMMDVDEGQYYELDPVAARIWTLMDERQTLRSICEALMEEYDIGAETCEEDTREFVQAAVGMRIVQVEAHLGGRV